MRGFRPGVDDAVYLAEDFRTAEFFAKTTPSFGGQMPKSLTVIEMRMSSSVAEELTQRGFIGEFRGARFIQPGTSPYERILVGDNIHRFNDLLRQGLIQVRRIRL
jgi:hypothetical protein